jgi:hypothetical protein
MRLGATLGTWKVRDARGRDLSSAVRRSQLDYGYLPPIYGYLHFLRIATRMQATEKQWFSGNAPPSEAEKQKK